MKKNFKFYLLGWFLLLAVFNVLAFVIPSWNSVDKYTATFWLGYGVITVAFLGQLVCAWQIFKQDSSDRVFYNLSLLKVASGALTVTFIVGAACIVISAITTWIAIVVCSLTLVFSAIAVVKANVAVDLVQQVDVKVATSTAFVIKLRQSSSSLVMRAKNEQARSLCKKISDAFRFSDPVSSEAVKNVESSIEQQFEQFKQSVINNDMDAMQQCSDELCALITERNSICKSSKL